MKSISILVIDKPVNCIDCLFNHQDKSCVITETSFMSEKGFDLAKERLKDCPLRDLPQKEVVNEYDFENYRNGVSIGWNRCLEKITGE